MSQKCSKKFSNMSQKFSKMSQNVLTIGWMGQKWQHLLHGWRKWCKNGSKEGFAMVLKMVLRV